LKTPVNEHSTKCRAADGDFYDLSTCSAVPTAGEREALLLLLIRRTVSTPSHHPSSELGVGKFSRVASGMNMNGGTASFGHCAPGACCSQEFQSIRNGASCLPLHEQSKREREHSNGSYPEEWAIDRVHGQYKHADLHLWFAEYKPPYSDH
jgi:hypothetical protein